MRGRAGWLPSWPSRSGRLSPIPTGLSEDFFVLCQSREDKSGEVRRMSNPFQSEDVETLRHKLRAVTRLIESFEARVEKLWGRVSTEALVQEQENPKRLLEATREGCIRIANLGGPTSLIQDDLSQATADLGIEQQQRLNDLFRSIAVRSAKFLNRESLGLSQKQLYWEALHLTAEIGRLIEEALEPARLVRKQLMEELRQRTAAEKQRGRRALKNKRDQRIRELKRENPGCSLTKLARIALEDPRIQQLKEPVSKDIVREALTRRKKRGASPKGSKSAKTGLQTPSGKRKRGKKRE